MEFITIIFDMANMSCIVKYKFLKQGINKMSVLICDLVKRTERVLEREG